MITGNPKHRIMFCIAIEYATKAYICVKWRYFHKKSSRGTFAFEHWSGLIKIDN
jgi:hypothetical protein